MCKLIFRRHFLVHFNRPTLRSGKFLFFPLFLSYFFYFDSFFIKKWRWQESNRGSLASKATALPTAPQPLPRSGKLQQKIVHDAAKRMFQKCIFLLFRRRVLKVKHEKINDSNAEDKEMAMIDRIAAQLVERSLPEH